MNCKDSLSSNLNKYTDLIVKEYHFKSYHFIELFIYFNNFVEREYINEESFITANTTLLNAQEDEEEEIEVLSKNVFSVLTSNSEASLVSLCCYLKQISISTFLDFDVDVLFSLLDKDNKGYIEYTDIETLISTFEDFINETSDWEVYEKSFGGKKIIKRNLTQNHFFDALKKLFGKANKLIENRVENMTKELEEDKKQVANSNFPVIQGIIVNSKKAPTSVIPRLQLENKNSLINGKELEGLPELLLDNRKMEIIGKIKKTSLLYDIVCNEFLYEFSQYESETFNKNKFIKVLNEIISKKTSNLLLSTMVNLSLSMLFQIIDFMHNNKISFYEVIGGVVPMTKTFKEYDIMRILFKYPKDKIVLILSGYMSLYLNQNKIKDIYIFSEIIFQCWNQDNIRTVFDLFQWIYKGTNKELEFIVDTYNITEIPESPTNQDIDLIFKTIGEKFIEVKTQFPYEIQSLPVLEMTTELLKYSFLGVINAFQLSTLLENVIGARYSSESVKKRLINECMSIIEKHFGFTQNELIDIIHLHAYNMLIFSGKTIERFQSIFLIHDIADNDPIEYEDLCEYLTHMFGFALKETKIEWCNGKALAQIICNYIVSKFDKKITLTCLMHVYDTLISSFPQEK